MFDRPPILELGASRVDGGSDWTRRGPLAWRQPSWRRREWELTAGDERLAVFRAAGKLRSLFFAETESGTWRIRSRWTGACEIQSEGDDSPAAKYTPGWFGRGRIVMRGGGTLRWRREGLLTRRWAITDDEGFPFLHLQSRRAVFRTEGLVEFEDSSRWLPDPEPLVLLAWRLLLASLQHKGG